MGKEVRSAPRFDFGLRVVVLGSNEAHFTKDISMKGCFLPVHLSFQVGDQVDLAIDVPGFGHVPITGEVRHVAENGIGILFSEIKDDAGREVLEEFLEVVALCEEPDPREGLGWLQ